MGNDAGFFCVQCGCSNPLHARFCRFCGHPAHSVTAHISLSEPDGRSSAAPSPESKPVAAVQHVQVGALLKQRYRIVKQVGSGGYGKVYRAVDAEFMDRRVAVKEMIQHGLTPEEVVEASDSFKQEAVLLATLTHPNLPSIYDYFSENGNWYLVMSFIEGETLDSYIRQRGPVLPVEKVLSLAIQLATVLSFLHTRKPTIIFRDLKPANVMRTPEGQLYLIDFGIARHFKWGQVKDTLVLGSPGYAAPEQYGRAQTTPQTDVYSLGILLHQMLTGLDPTLTPFRHPKIDLPDYPQLSILISCMLEMDAKKRPASMGNIQRELQRIATGRVRTTHHPAQLQRRLLHPDPPNSSQVVPAIVMNVPAHIASPSGNTPHYPHATMQPSAAMPLIPVAAPTFTASQVPGQNIWTKLNTMLSQAIKLR